MPTRTKAYYLLRAQQVYDLRIEERWTYDRIARRYRISRERVRQILYGEACRRKAAARASRALGLWRAA